MGELSKYCRLFFPRAAFDEFYIMEDTEDDSENVPIFGVNYSLLVDFLNLSLIRGPTTIVFTAWKDLDHINLK